MKAGPIGPGTLLLRAVVFRPDGSGRSESGEIRRTIPAQPNPMDFVAAERYEVRRVERYVALFAGFRVPYVADATIESGFYGSHYDFSDLIGRLTSSERWDLSASIEQIFLSAQVLLDSIADDSFIGKAVENVGEAAIDEDEDRRFVHSWNAIELLAKQHYLETHGKDLKSPFPRNVGVRKFVPPFLKVYSGAKVFPDVGHLADLRNGIAHGGLSDPPGRSVPEHLERWDKGEAIRDLAVEVLIDVLGERRIIPKADRPVHARVLVPSLRPDWKVEPIDDSAVLASKKPRWAGETDGDRS